MAREWFKGPIFFGFPIPDYTAIRRQHISLLYHTKLPLLKGVKRTFAPCVRSFVAEMPDWLLRRNCPKYMHRGYLLNDFLSIYMHNVSTSCGSNDVYDLPYLTLTCLPIYYMLPIVIP